jgi:hypothetical protein
VSVWQRVKEVRDLWAYDPRLTRAGRNKARFSAVLAAVLGVVCLVERAWGLLAVCVVGFALLVLVAIGAGQDAREDH